MQTKEKNVSFKDYFTDGSVDRFSTDALADIDYDAELAMKNKAITAMLAAEKINIAAAPVIPSPLPRKYRTTTKRRVSIDGKKIYFHFGRKHGRDAVALSVLEPDEHLGLYRFFHRIFSENRNFKAAAVLNYVIIRGGSVEHAVIFNVKRLSGDIVRILKSVTNETVKNFPAVKSIFLYVDKSGSDYYLEAERPVKGISFKKLYGSEQLAIRLNDKKFLYSPISFSQINESILPFFFEELKKYLEPDAQTRMMDIYCGYGLWSLALGDSLKYAWGIELSDDSVKAAAKNAAFHYPDKHFQYVSGFVTAELLRAKMPPPAGKNEVILLDPPRKGCAAGVLETIISRRPRKIFHMFCGADEIVPALNIYLANNCNIEKLIPFDFFPGTMNIEMLAVISR